MKNIIICGPAKSGKSLLCRKLNETGIYNHIPLDYFTSSFKHNFSELGISSDVIIKKETSEKLSLLLGRVMNIINSVDNDNYIIDSAHIYPTDIIKYIDRNKWDIIFLGYPNINPIDKLKEVKKYINNGWIIDKSDEELIYLFTNLINISKVIEKECLDNNIKFIDVSDENYFKSLQVKGISI